LTMGLSGVAVRATTRSRISREDMVFGKVVRSE
jgi:hypothetical protein